MKLLKLILVSAGCATLILSLIYLPDLLSHGSNSTEKREETPLSQASMRDFREAEHLLYLKYPLEASRLIKKHYTEMDRDTLQGKQWLDLLVQAAEAMGDTAQLVYLFQYYPEGFMGRETAALKVANYLIAHGDWKNYQILQGYYQASPGLPELKREWILLDADNLILQGKPLEAEKFLKSHSFAGKEDTGRLLRLALLRRNEHPQIAWSYFEQALAKDPSNTDLHLYRARLLEVHDKKPLAQAEYYILSRMPEADPFSKEELTHFFLREHNYKMARQYIVAQLKTSKDPALWLKGLFLAKVVEPLPKGFERYLPLDTPNSHLIQALASLPANTFWDDSITASPNEALLWLQVLQKLKIGREEEALAILESPFLEQEVSDKVLADSLISTIKYRTRGEIPKKLPLLVAPHEPLSTDLLHHLKGPNGYAALFSARGWAGAASQVRQP